MEHIHLKECESTQKYLMELSNQKKIDEVLVSCDVQTNGVGQRNNSWDSYFHGLCLSFIIPPNEILNLTSLEMGVLICNFFDEYFGTQLKLKWPNDILNTRGEKVGGILINKQGEQNPIIGMGINLFPKKDENIKDYPIKAGFAFDDPIIENKQELAQKIFSYIKENRLGSSHTKDKWNTLCSHLEKQITLVDSEKIIKGTFIGIGDYGQAIIQANDQLNEYYSGTLRINN